MGKRNSRIKLGAVLANIALLVALIVVLLPGCGGGSPEVVKPIKFGTIQPLTGSDAQEGEQQVRGIKMALDEVGWEVAGRPIELIVEDDESWNFDACLSKLNKLILQDKVDIMVGNYWSSPLLAVKDLLMENNIPVIATWCNEPKLQDAAYFFENYFSVGMSLEYQCPRVAGAAMYYTGYRNVIVMAPDIPACRGAGSGIKKAIESLGGHVVAEIYTPEGELNYSPYLLSAPIDEADLLYNYYWGAMGPAFAKAYADLGLTDRIDLWGTGTFDDDTLDILKEMGIASNMVGYYQISEYVESLATPANQAWIKSMTDRYGETFATSGALLAYNAAQVAFKGIEAVNGDLSQFDRFRTALKEVNLETPSGPLTFGKFNTACGSEYLLQVVDENDNIFGKVVRTWDDVCFDWMPPRQ